MKTIYMTGNTDPRFNWKDLFVDSLFDRYNIPPNSEIKAFDKSDIVVINLLPTLLPTAKDLLVMYLCKKYSKTLFIITDSIFVDTFDNEPIVFLSVQSVIHYLKP